MLHHPNIVAYFDSFVEDKALMIVMEYAEGGTIFEFLQSRETLLDEEEILHLFVQMVLSLQVVHDHNILHRDLKTQNIMLDKTKKVGSGVARPLGAWRRVTGIDYCLQYLSTFVLTFRVSMREMAIARHV